MARFPKQEAEIRALAQRVVAGLTNNPGLFPSPPVSPAALQAALDAFIARGEEAVAARALAEQATAAKRASLEELKAAMRAVLRYAEGAVNRSDPELSLLGWGAKAPGASLAVPGQVRNLVITEQGETGLTLEWEKPVDGGTVATYKIERRVGPDGAWGIVSIAMKRHAVLTDQSRGKDLEYRVIAVNKTGEGPPSNTVAAVL